MNFIWWSMMITGCDRTPPVISTEYKGYHIEVEQFNGTPPGYVVHIRGGKGGKDRFVESITPEGALKDVEVDLDEELSSVSF